MWTKEMEMEREEEGTGMTTNVITQGTTGKQMEKDLHNLWNANKERLEVNLE